jgi:hemerythrin-like domain-containing protein
MKSTKFLMQEHKLILRALDVLDSMAGSAEKNGKIDNDDIGSMLDFLRWFADAHHQVKEETLLFPALRRAAAAQNRSVQHMMLEHEQERGLIDKIETAVRMASIPDLVVSIEKLSSILRNHIYKEDQILFEVTREAVTGGADDELLDQLGRFETTVDKDILAKKLEGLRSLEWKYMRRAS